MKSLNSQGQWTSKFALKFFLALLLNNFLFISESFLPSKIAKWQYAIANAQSKPQPTAAGGWLAGTNAARIVQEKDPLTMPHNTMMGFLFEFISSADRKHFQPMPPNFGILPSFPTKIKSKKERYQAYRDRSLSDLDLFQFQVGD